MTAVFRLLVCVNGFMGERVCSKDGWADVQATQCLHVRAAVFVHLCTRERLTKSANPFCRSLFFFFAKTGATN